MLNLIIIILPLLFSLGSINVLAQETIEDRSCPNNSTDVKNDSDESLELFLSDDGFEAARIEQNLNSLQHMTTQLLTGSS